MDSNAINIWITSVGWSRRIALGTGLMRRVWVNATEALIFSRRESRGGGGRGWVTCSRTV